MKTWSLAIFAPLVLAFTVQPVAAQATLFAEDHAEIRQLYAQYNHTLDFGDAVGWADTFTEDGVFQNNRGRAALIEFAEGFYEGQEGYSRHWNSQLTLTPTAEGARGSVYLMLWSTRTSPPRVIVTGVYRDVLVRTDDGWRFAERSVEVDRPAQSDGG